ncbi:unannotated protein [freshwater metagenome]|uniref:Unannotated protein n=1 Tax=freshwater metagenome TaxID=449393 RepID=A0A6J7L8C5_9ZZZZ
MKRANMGTKPMSAPMIRTAAFSESGRTEADSRNAAPRMKAADWRRYGRSSSFDARCAPAHIAARMSIATPRATIPTSPSTRPLLSVDATAYTSMII